MLIKKVVSAFLALMLAGSLAPVTLAADEVNIVTTNGGNAAVGNTLKADVTGTSGDVSYQWYAGDAAIEGATFQEFVPTYMEFGKSIKCAVTDDSGEKMSEAVTLVSAFDSHKDTAWNLMGAVKIGDEETGNGDSSWNFSMKNDYGTKLNFTILDIQNNKESKYYILANDYYKLHKNSTSENALYNPNVEGSFAYAVNNEFSEKKDAEFDLPDVIVDSIDENHVWITEKDKAGKIPAPYIVKAGITVPAIWEIREYVDRIKIDIRKPEEVTAKNAMWLRTAYNDKNYHGINSNADMVLYSDSNKYHFKLSMMGITSGNGYIRPQFFLDEDFFKKAKIDLSTAGANVIKEISKYSYKELSEIYTDSDIALYLPDVEGAGKKITVIINTTDKKAATVGNTVSATVKNAQGNVSYQWYADGEMIEGETSDTLILTYDYFEKEIFCIANDGVSESTSNVLSVTSDFDKHKDTSWANLVAVTLGTTKVGFGNKDWEFEMQNGYGQNLNFSLLKVDNNSKSKFYVLANDYYGVAYNNSTSNPDVVDAIYNPQMEGTVAYNINTNFMKKDGSKNSLPEAMVDAIDTEHVWITEKDNDKYISAPFTVKAGITTSAVWEIREYVDRIKIDIRKDTEIVEMIQAWLRSPLKHNHYLAVGVNPSGDGNKYEDLVLLSGMTNNYYFKVNGLHISNSRGYLRPQFFLNEDFFLNAKIDLSKAGKGIIRTLGEEYTREELLTVYTEAELEAAGLGSNYGMEVVWKSGNAEIQSLNGVTDLSAQISLTNTLSEDKKCIVIVSLYDKDGKVIKMTAKDVTMTKGSITDVPLMTLSGLTGVTNEYKAHVYVWDNLFDMNSLAVLEEI